MQRPGEVRQDDILWLLGSLCGLFRIPFDGALIAQGYPPPYDLVTLHEAARALGIKTGHYPLANIDWQKLPLPAIAFQAPKYAISPSGEDSPTDALPESTLAPLLIVKASSEQLLCFRPGSQSPETMTVADAATRLAPELILVAHDSAASDETPGLSANEKAQASRFGFSLVHPRTPQAQAHLARRADRQPGDPARRPDDADLHPGHHRQGGRPPDSIHARSSSASRWLMFMLFTAVMSWLRQYLVLHTGNRIDAVLGSQVFRHLLRLPLPYFEHRQTGTLVARLHGVETIREFVSGAAVS
jgi:subfamily B ATP-binding cassette protein HlyB/CyaB